MSLKPKLTVSGFRGIWDEDLNEKIAFGYALAFAKLIKRKGAKKILIGRDARSTGPEILRAIKNATKKEGLEMDYAGIIPTPSILLLVKKLSYDGGIIITASHNPKEYNGFKFVANDGLFIRQEEINELEENRKKLKKEENNYSKNFVLEDIEKNNKNEKFKKIHIDEILKNINVNLIKSKKFKVALDSINSAGSIITQELLKKLGCIVHAINTEQTGNFAHEPEPLVKNLDQIKKATIKSNSDIGFAQDPDADRLVMVNEKGEILSEEYTLTLATLSVFSRKDEVSDMAINMSSSRMCEDILNKYEKKIFRTKIGELNVVNKMLEINASISGEGNGGVIYPKINKTRDSLVGIALILELLARKNKTVSSIVESLPKYVMKKEKITFEKDFKILSEKLKDKFKDAKVDTLDGIRFDWDDFSWIHIRRSNTEPKMWIISEARDLERVDTLFKIVKSVI